MNYEVGQVVEGIVTGIQAYGAFIALDDGYSGLIHISEISDGYVREVERFIKLDQKITVTIIDIDQPNKHLKLSLKALKKKSSRQVRKQHYRYYRRRGIIETPLGFSSLANALPKFIEKAEKEMGEMKHVAN